MPFFPPAPPFIKNEAVPRGVWFPTSHSLSPTLFVIWENWFRKVTAQRNLLS